MADEKECPKNDRPLFKATRMVLLAAVGAAALARDEMKGVMERSVARGEVAEAEARKLMREMLDRREKAAQERKEHSAAAQSQAASHADVEALSARIAELTRQIEDLKKQKAA